MTAAVQNIVNDTERAFEDIPFTAMSRKERYNLLAATVVPRPIALVTTLDEDGSVNAAPFSQFVMLSAQPAILGFVVARFASGEMKDTHRNIDRDGEFVINTVSEELALATQLCAFPFDAGVSEAERIGLVTLPSLEVAPPRLAASPVHFECRLLRMESFGEHSTLIAGSVVRVHAARDVLSGQRVAHDLYRPLGRIAGRRYCMTERVVEIDRAEDDLFTGQMRAGVE